MGIDGIGVDLIWIEKWPVIFIRSWLGVVDDCYDNYDDGCGCIDNCFFYLHKKKKKTTSIDT